MAIAFGSKGAGANGTTSLSVPYPASISAGDMLLLVVINKTETAAPSTPTGFTAPSNNQFISASGQGLANDSGDVVGTVFYREADGTETGNVSVTITGGNCAVGAIYRYTKDASKEWEVATHQGADSTAGTSFSATAGGDPGLDTGDMLVACAGLNTDAQSGTGNWGSLALSATGATFGSITAEGYDETLNGGDAAAVVFDAAVSAGPSSGAPTFSSTLSSVGGNGGVGGVVFVRLREIDASAPPDEEGTVVDGTTDAALESWTGVRLGYSLVIDGFDYILTSSSDLDAVVTAYSGSGWTQALPGLSVIGAITQQIRPWQSDLDPPMLQFEITPDDADTFGKALWRTKPTFSTRLAAAFAPAADGSGTMTLQRNDDLAAAGVVYVGNQRVAYTAKPSGTELTVAAGGSGELSVFNNSGGNPFHRPVAHPDNFNWEMAPPSVVSDTQRKWEGRKVKLLLHHIQNGVWAPYTDARLEFAGRIVSFKDTPEGKALLEVEDLRGQIADSVILRRQWVGYVKHGVRLVAGTRFYAREATTSATVKSGYFTVVESGAAGTDEIDEGYYETPVFLSRLQQWLQNDGTLTARWNVSLSGTNESGIRTRIVANFTSSAYRTVHIYCSSREPLEFLGYDVREAQNENDEGWFKLDSIGGDFTDFSITSQAAPYKCKLFQGSKGTEANRLHGDTRSRTFQVDSSEGSWFNQATQLPGLLRLVPESGEDWGVLECGGQVFMAQRQDSTTFSNFVASLGILGKLSTSAASSLGLTYDDDTDTLPVRQVLVLGGSFTDVITKLVASVDGSGNNHATYDVIGGGGGAGIPWSLLGDSWLDSCRNLEESSNTKGLLVVVREPTELQKILVPELQLRFAWLLFKDGGYQLVSPATPSAITPDHVLTEDNKADADGSDPQRAVSERTDEFLRNIVRIKYGLDVEGTFHRNLTVREPASEADTGISRAVTIEARNAYAWDAEAGASVEELAAALMVRTFPHWAKSLHVIRRTIAPTLYTAMTPGDTCTVSDNFARSPETGERGVANRAGIVLSVSYDRGNLEEGMFGEVTVLCTDEDRTYPLSPSFEVDTTYTSGDFTNGYDGTNNRLKLKQHQYSKSTAAKDITHVDAGDLIRLVELDPTNTAAPDAWNVTVQSKDETNDILTLTGALAAPAWSGSSTKRIIGVPRSYSVVQSSQQLHAFQADDSTGEIEASAQPNLYGESAWEAFTAADPTTLPALLADELYGDGKPLTPAHLQGAAVMLNNLAHYKTAPHSPMLFHSTQFGGNPVIYLPAYSAPFYLGTQWPGGYGRKLRVAPMMRVTGAITGYIRVTSSRFMPKPHADGTRLDFQGPSRSVEFTTTSTSWAEAAEQELLPVRAGLPPACTWITVEYKVSSAIASVGGYGLTRLYLGPLESL